MSRIVRRALTSTLLAASAAAALAVTASPAYALGPSTVSKSGGTLTVTAAPGTDNHTRVLEEANTFFIRDINGGVRGAAGSGCVNEGTIQVRCPKAGITRVVVNSGDFNDNIGVGAPAGSRVQFEVLLGPGTDVTAVNTPNSTVRGEGDNDNLANTSSQFPATLDGGAGTDRCPIGRNVIDNRISCESR